MKRESTFEFASKMENRENWNLTFNEITEAMDILNEEDLFCESYEDNRFTIFPKTGETFLYIILDFDNLWDVFHEYGNWDEINYESGDYTNEDILNMFLQVWQRTGIEYYSTLSEELVLTIHPIEDNM